MCFCSIMEHRQSHVLILFQLRTCIFPAFELALSQHPFMEAVCLPSGKL